MSEVCNDFDKIANFANYFQAGNGEMEFGVHGPEINEGKMYISAFHFMEYLGLNTKNYDTKRLGKYLTEKSIKYLKCKYKAQTFDINKFDTEFLCSEIENFKNFNK